MNTIGTGLWSVIRSAINFNFTSAGDRISALESTEHTHANESVLNATQQSYTTADKAKLGVAATLDANGTLDSTQIPSSLLSGLMYEGDLDIDTESTLDMSLCSTGCFYKMQSASGASGVSIDVTWDDGGTSKTVAVITNANDWIVLSETGPSDWGIAENPATTSTKGVIKLAGDLSGTSETPSVVTVGGSDPFDREKHTGEQGMSTVTGLSDALTSINTKLELPQTDTDPFLSANSSSPQKICDLPGLEDDFQLEWDISSGGSAANVELRKKNNDGSYLAVARWSQVTNSSSTNANVVTDNNSASTRILGAQNDLLRISHHVSFSNTLANEIIELFVVPNTAGEAAAYKYEILALRKSGDENGRAYVRRIA